MPFLTRGLSATRFGHLVIALALAQATALVCTLGTPGALTSGSRELRREPRLGRSVVALGCLSALGVTLAAALAASAVGSASLRTCLLGVSAGGCLGASTVVQAELRARSLHGRASLLVAATWLVGMGSGTLWAVRTGGPDGVLIALGVVAVALAAFGYARSADGLLGELPHAREHAAAMRRRGFILLPHALAMFAIGSGDRLVIPLASSSAEVARYQVAYSVGAITLMGVAALGMVWAPDIHAARDDERSRRDWEASLTTSMRSAVVALGCLVLLIPTVLAVLAPPEFDRYQLSMLAIIVAASSLPYVCYQGLMHIALRDRPSVGLSVAAPMIGLASVVSCYVAVRLFGLVGAALVTLLAYTGLWVAVGQRAGQWWLRRSARALVVGSAPLVVAVPVLAVISARLPIFGWGLPMRLVLTGGVIACAWTWMTAGQRLSVTK